MIGIAFLVFIIFWTFCCGLLSWGLSSLLPASKWRPVVGVVLFVVLTSSLFIDEVIGNWQFQRLCEENSAIYIAPNAKGRTVYFVPTPEQRVQGTWIKIILHPLRFVDAATGELCVSYTNLRAGGGWFMRFLEWNGMGAPLLFEGSYQPPNAPVNAEMFKKLGIKYIERPEHKNGDSK